VDILPTTEWLHKELKARPRSIPAGQLDYQRSLRLSIHALWGDKISLFDFIDSATATIRRGFSRAFYEGAAVCGISPAELTSFEINALQTEINQESLYLLKFASTISQERKGDQLLRAHLTRLPMWVNRYEMMRNLGQVYACKDQKLAWVIGPTREHCADCLRLDGRVYRASTWQSSGWVPKGRSLACGGYKCLCAFSPTSLPITPGPAPKLF